MLLGHYIRMIRQSIPKKKAISVIRLGDVIGKLLTRQELVTLRRVSPFLGIPYPPPANLYRDLEKAVLQADIVGVTHFPKGIVQLKQFMKREKWSPRYITDSFINDQLYDSGLLHRLIKHHSYWAIRREGCKTLEKQRLYYS